MEQPQDDLPPPHSHLSPNWGRWDPDWDPDTAQVRQAAPWSFQIAHEVKAKARADAAKAANGGRTPPRPKWQQYGGYYRPIDDVKKPWEPSPRVSSPLPLPNAPVFQVSLNARNRSGNSANPGDVTAGFNYGGSPVTSEGGGSLGSWEVQVYPVPNTTVAVASTALVLSKSKGRLGGMEAGPSTRPPRRRSKMSKWRERLAGWLSPDSDLPERRRSLDDDRPHRARNEVYDSRPRVKSIGGVNSRPKPFDRVQPHEWKEWGYWARPYIRGVQVYNTLSPYLSAIDRNVDYPMEFIQHTTLTPEEVFESLRDPDGSRHPERWKLGIVHPSLPPKPQRWLHPPNPTHPLPFPWEVQLNPFLEHIMFGVPRMFWDISADITACLYGIEEDPAARPLFPADLAQPASYPFLTHMYINALADDISLKFAWPIMVINEEGIKVRDVVNSIYENFQQYVFEGEYWSWTMGRRREAVMARKRRCDPLEHEWLAMAGEIMVDDRMRRIDYLVGRTLFRGLAPNPDATGWVLYLGQN